MRRRDIESYQGKETMDACLFLARYFLDKNNNDEAKKYAERLREYNGPENEIAKEIMEKLESPF